MDTKSKINGFGILLYGIAVVSFLLGAILNFSDSVRTGTTLISIGVAMACSTAVTLGHLKRR
jgi:hypothetical protein